MAKTLEQPATSQRPTDPVGAKLSKFKDQQRSSRSGENAPAAHREGHHVTLGTGKKLAPNFTPSHGPSR